jgi:hypothetical protein
MYTQAALLQRFFRLLELWLGAGSAFDMSEGHLRSGEIGNEGGGEERKRNDKLYSDVIRLVKVAEAEAETTAAAAATGMKIDAESMVEDPHLLPSFTDLAIPHHQDPSAFTSAIPSTLEVLRSRVHYGVIKKMCGQVWRYGGSWVGCAGPWRDFLVMDEIW